MKNFYPGCSNLRSPRKMEYVNYDQLRLYPFRNPLRGDPRFEQIVDSLAPKDGTP